MNVYDQQTWGIEITGPCNILACESFKFASEYAAKFNDWIVRKIIPESLKDDPIMFASVFMWDEKVHGEHDPSGVNWDDPF